MMLKKTYVQHVEMYQKQTCGVKDVVESVGLLTPLIDQCFEHGSKYSNNLIDSASYSKKNIQQVSCLID